MLARQIAVLVRDAIGHILGTQAARLIAEEEHLAGLRIDARMRREGLRAQRAIIIPAADRLQRMRINLITKPIFLGHEQPPRVPDRRGIGDGAVLALGGGIIRERIAILAKQRAPRLALQLVTLGLDIADRIIDLAAAYGEAGNHAIARQHDIIRIHGRHGRIGHRAEKRAIHLGGNVPDHIEIARRPFDADRCIQSGEVDGFREVRHCHPPICSFLRSVRIT